MVKGSPRCVLNLFAFLLSVGFLSAPFFCASHRVTSKRGEPCKRVLFLFFFCDRATFPALFLWPIFDFSPSTPVASIKLGSFFLPYRPPSLCPFFPFLENLAFFFSLLLSPKRFSLNTRREDLFDSLESASLFFRPPSLVPSC